VNEKELRRREESGPGSDRWAKRVARALMELDRMCDVDSGRQIELRALKMRLGETDHEETLVIVTAWDDAGAPIVCFSQGMTPSEALVGAINRIANGSVTWKEDQYGNA
jgi:hypothetical protein